VTHPISASPHSISQERLKAFDEAATAELARRLEEDDYPSAFASLEDWHLLRALAIHRPDLAAPYVHLVDQEPFDED
jgi:Protein of unknown function (DUF2555)